MSEGADRAYKALMDSIQGEVERRLKAYFSEEWMILRVPRSCVPAGAELVECYQTETEWVIVGLPDDSEQHNCDAMGCSSLTHVVARVPRWFVPDKPADTPPVKTWETHGCSTPGCGYPDGKPCIRCGLVIQPGGANA